MSATPAVETHRSPTVYFIDDSATMREVMKIAFRRENISVVACHDAVEALQLMEESAPDIVITDVIMPDKDGFEVCQAIKQHPRLSSTPVVLLSGVVNRDVADKAFAVKADELIRKPFQPQDLIARVKQLLAPKNVIAMAPAPAIPSRGGSHPAAVLSGIFGSSPRPLASPNLNASDSAPRAAAPVAPQPPAPRAASADAVKLRLEIARLENLVKKLQSELAAEREYAHALEAHVKTLQDTD